MQKEESGVKGEKDHDLTSLLERVEACKGPDRELDAAIEVALSGDPRSWTVGEGWWRDCEDNSRRASFLTASIDAALALVAEKLPGWDVTSSKSYRDIGNYARVFHDGLKHEPSFVSTGNRPVQLLILSALLRALIAQQQVTETKR